MKRSEMRIRGWVIECMIDRDKCREVDPVLDRVIDDHVIIYKGTYICPICGRMFDKRRGIKYHIAVAHKYHVDYYVSEYIRAKYRGIGWY